MSYSDILIFHYELEDGSWEGVLTPTAFKDLFVAGKLKYPTITKEEIDDRSKGDGISKSLALLQLFWFILQIAIRSHYGLASTFIEWITMALCLICSMMYTFWMDKPFNAHCPVVLRILGPDEGLTDEREGTTTLVIKQRRPEKAASRTSFHLQRLCSLLPITLSRRFGTLLRAQSTRWITSLWKIRFCQAEIRSPRQRSSMSLLQMEKTWTVFFSTPSPFTSAV